MAKKAIKERYFPIEDFDEIFSNVYPATSDNLTTEQFLTILRYEKRQIDEGINKQKVKMLAQISAQIVANIEEELSLRRKSAELAQSELKEEDALLQAITREHRKRVKVRITRLKIYSSLRREIKEEVEKVKKKTLEKATLITNLAANAQLSETEKEVRNLTLESLQNIIELIANYQDLIFKIAQLSSSENYFSFNSGEELGQLLIIINYLVDFKNFVKKSTVNLIDLEKVLTSLPKINQKINQSFRDVKEKSKDVKLLIEKIENQKGKLEGERKDLERKIIKITRRSATVIENLDGLEDELNNLISELEKESLKSKKIKNRLEKLNSLLSLTKEKKTKLEKIIEEKKPLEGVEVTLKDTEKFIIDTNNELREVPTYKESESTPPSL